MRTGVLRTVPLAFHVLQSFLADAQASGVLVTEALQNVGLSVTQFSSTCYTELLEYLHHGKRAVSIGCARPVLHKSTLRKRRLVIAKEAHHWRTQERSGAGSSRRVRPVFGLGTVIAASKPVATGPCSGEPATSPSALP